MCLVMLDLSAAFDTVNHHLLLNRLKYRFGICCLVLSWLKSYLTNRSQCVMIHNEDGSTVESSKRPLKQGIPQGSILGPILFSVFVPPLGELCRAHGVSFQGHADDTQNYLSFRPISGSQKKQIECITKLENCLDAVHHWMQTNFLKFNENKTEFIILGLSQRLKKVGNISFRIGEDIIHNVPMVKNLGMFLDAELKHTTHINKLTSSSFNTLHNIVHIWCHLDQETTTVLMQALILSKIDYCNSLFLGIPKYNIAKLQRIQNLSFKIIFQLPKHSSINNYLVQIHWLNIQECITYKVATIMYRSVHNIAPRYLTEMVFSELTHNRNLRSLLRRLLYTTKSRTEFVHSASFKSMGPHIWNTFLDCVRNSNKITLRSLNLNLRHIYLENHAIKLHFC